MTNGDIIKQLPTDNDIPSDREIKIMNELFEEQTNMASNIASKNKNIIFIGILFMLFSSSILDNLIKKYIPVAINNYLLIVIKTLVFMLSVFIVQNWSFSRV